jgi:MFS family permease
MNERKRSNLFYGYIIVLACFVFQAIGIGAYVAFGVFFKPLLAEFGWSRAAISGASSMAFLLMGFLGILAGNLNDRFGPRIIMAVTGIFYGTGYFLLSQLHSVWQLYLFFGLVVGIGLSSIDVIALTTTARWFIRRRGIMTGLVKTGTGAGQLFMPLLASLLIADCGWRHAAVYLGIILLVFIIGSGQLLRRDPSQMGQWPEGGTGPPIGQAGASESGLSLVEALGSGQFWLICTINFLVVSCLMTILVHIVPHASDIGLDSIKSAGVLSTIGGASIGGRLLTGIAIDRIGSKKTIILCFLLLVASFLWLQVAGGIWMLYLFAVVYGVSHGGFFTLISPTVAELFGMGSHGVLIGIVVCSGTLGGAIGPLVAGHVFDVAQSYQQVFLIMAGVGMAASLLSLFLKPAVRKAWSGG